MFLNSCLLIAVEKTEIISDNGVVCVVFLDNFEVKEAESFVSIGVRPTAPTGHTNTRNVMLHNEKTFQLHLVQIDISYSTKEYLTLVYQGLILFAFFFLNPDCSWSTKT